MDYFCKNCEIKVDNENECENCGESNIVEIYYIEDVESIKENLMRGLVNTWLRNGNLNIAEYVESMGIKLAKKSK